MICYHKNSYNTITSYAEKETLEGENKNLLQTKVDKLLQ